MSRKLASAEQKAAEAEEAQRDMSDRLHVMETKHSTMAAAVNGLEQAFTMVQRDRQQAELRAKASAEASMRITLQDGRPLRAWLKDSVMPYLLRHEPGARPPTSKYFQEQGDGIADLELGKPTDAALGLLKALQTDPLQLYEALAQGTEGIKAEVAAHGTEEDKECLEYVLHMEAGSSPKIFPNSPYRRDCDERGLLHDRRLPNGKGMRLADFVNSRVAQDAHLDEWHVVALRLYTTAAYKSINASLRNGTRHPLPATVYFLDRALRKLRAVDPLFNRSFDLWRGMRNLKPTGEFERNGGAECALMSTTSEATVALRYALSHKALLMKIVTSRGMHRGADLSWVSVFPNEREFCYPPLTYLNPTGKREVVSIEAGAVAEGSPQMEVTVIEVTPSI